jgi:hypothetical protein
MNNVALRAGVLAGLYVSSGAASQQTGILGADTARRMRVRGIPLACQPEEDAGLQVDATDAISAVVTGCPARPGRCPDPELRPQRLQ